MEVRNQTGSHSYLVSEHVLNRMFTCTLVIASDLWIGGRAASCDDTAIRSSIVFIRDASCLGAAFRREAIHQRKFSSDVAAAPMPRLAAPYTLIHGAPTRYLV